MRGLRANVRSFPYLDFAGLRAALVARTLAVNGSPAGSIASIINAGVAYV